MNQPEETEKKSVGRKRDPELDTHILKAALDLLAEVGYDSMTMDMVAQKAKSSKATIYRRWSSKPELVKDALINMSRSAIELEMLPDTGNLREDLLAVLKPHSAKHQEQKLKILAGLGSFFSNDEKIAEEALDGVFTPWTDVNRTLMRRAFERGEISANADIELACQIIIAMTSQRSRIQKKTFDRKSYAELLDNILLPALKNNRKG